MVGGSFDDLPGDLEAHRRIHRRALLIEGKPDDRRAALFDQRQQLLEPLLLTGHRVDQRLALAHRQGSLQSLGHRRVERERHIYKLLHHLDHLDQQRGLIGPRNTRVDIQHRGASLDLGRGVGAHHVEVTFLELSGQRFATGRVDALADDDKGSVRTDDNALGR